MIPQLVDILFVSEFLQSDPRCSLVHIQYWWSAVIQWNNESWSILFSGKFFWTQGL